MTGIIYNTIIIYIAVICIAVSIIMITVNYLRTKKIMKSLDHMLDLAIKGIFTTEQINESMLSALEFKLSHYLSSSETSAKNVAIEKDKLKALISDISHQTKTPISNILLYSELLKEQALNEESQSYAEALNTQAQKLSFLIDSLVKMSRLETGILTLHPKTQPIMPLLEKTQEQFAGKAAQKGLTFSILYPDVNANANTDITAVFDEKWTLEALCNLIDNAIKYTSQGGITIKVTSYEMFCCIEIIDTGIGIAEEEQAQIFSRFYRSRQAADKEGVGIGLYLARKIVASEGGYIKLSSKLEKGSTFAVYLPI